MNRLRIQSAQSWLAHANQHIHYLWEKAVQPPKSMSDPEWMRRSRILNRILLVIIPTTLVVLVIQLGVYPVEKLPLSLTINSVLMGLAAALLVYLVNRFTQNFRLVSYLLVAVGIIAIVVNALSSAPPHLEISLLVLLSLCGTLLFTLRETLLLCTLNIALLVAFAAVIGDMPDEIVKDLILYMSLTQLFIVFVAHQRNRLEAERQQLALAAANHELLTRLINDLSHDFRTPLAVVNTTAYLLARTDDPQAREERSEQIIGQVGRLSKMLDDILTLSRLDATPDPTLTFIDVNPLVKALSEDFQLRLAAKNLHLSLDLMPNAPPVLASQTNLQRAFSKIIENAVQYTPAGGSITLRTRRANAALVVEIIDTGIGIPDYDLPMIFEYFYRGDKARSSNAGSTGLGLSIARRIVELYRGKIEVESLPDQGSAFRVFLPAGKSPLFSSRASGGGYTDPPPR
ncbi:MAG: HAMP domain-containing histidine kinase [Anaerolineae bacterium]|nr:HAMP domain-containing histidine kinase [Anaerolineae bacterium]